MSRKNSRRPLILPFLLLQALAVIASAIPLTSPVSLLNNTTSPAASTPFEDLISQNVTSPGTSPNMMDYHVVGTPLILRITATGFEFSETAVNIIIDAAIRRVVAKINTGSGKKPIEEGRFSQLSKEIDMRISAITNAELTYFLLGDALAGVWQYMSQPWSSFREIAFYIVLDGDKSWDYIGYGCFATYKPDPPPPSPEPSSSLSQNTSLVLNEIE